MRNVSNVTIIFMVLLFFSLPQNGPNSALNNNEDEHRLCIDIPKEFCTFTIIYEPLSQWLHRRINFTWKQLPIINFEEMYKQLMNSKSIGRIRQTSQPNLSPFLDLNASSKIWHHPLHRPHPAVERHRLPDAEQRARSFLERGSRLRLKSRGRNRASIWWHHAAVHGAVTESGGQEGDAVPIHLRAVMGDGRYGQHTITVVCNLNR